jgi:hypothetical protein
MARGNRELRNRQWLQQGRALGADRDWADDENDPGVTQVNIKRLSDGSGYWVRVEKFHVRHAYAEDLYLIDERRVFGTLDAALGYIDCKAGFALRELK